MNVLDAMTDVRLFGETFRPAWSWAGWRAFLAALFALPLDAEGLAFFRECTGRERPPAKPAREAYAIVGRRGGKSRAAAVLAVYLAVFRRYDDVLAPGERGVVMVLAADRRQARVVMDYCKALLALPMLRSLVERETAETVDLTNRIRLEIHAASFRSTRGYTVVAAILDELCFWRSDESAEPDTEVVNALRPAMATVPGAILLGISSPYARRGVMFRAWERHFGRDGDVIVWKAPSRTMNPLLPESVVEQALAEDPDAAAAEYLAEFRRDVESFVSREVVDSCTVPGRVELPPTAGHVAFVDPSGGSADAMTLCIAHAEERDGRRIAVLDALRERRPPFSPDDVTLEFSETLRLYGVSRVVGDRYAGLWPVERFQRYGITYQAAERTKSDLYRELLPILNSGRVELLDVPRLHAQLVALERRTARGGRDSIDHPPRAHDDTANAAAGAAHLAIGGAKRGLTPEDIYGPGGPYALHAQGGA